MSEKNTLGRRRFFKIATAGSLGAAIATPSFFQKVQAQEKVTPEKPETNIADAMKYPRNEHSMPGKYPGQVVRVNHPESIVDNEPVEEVVYAMIAKALLTLTGTSSLKDAWLKFVSPDDIIGLKVNPVAGKLLFTSHAVTKSVIRQLREAGIPDSNIVIWDRRDFQLAETGYTTDNYPGIAIRGTEIKDATDSFYDKNGEMYAEKMIDKNWYYWADYEEEYDAYTLPYMVNGGKYSYFSKICTQEVDKIINLPVLKNAGTSVTLCLKNLAFGSITNTGRLHKYLWSETCAEVCAFPPLRDKVVLNIVDGIKGCFDGGPGANPQFICNYNTILAGTDPVAVDRIGYNIVIAKRIEEGVQEEELARGRKFMELAAALGLGECDINKIDLKEINLL
ncbi:MAG: DUF362 domain-containing protein [Sphingobacteriia bacterium]|nr:DUF362 domain-containing protein [Sphingobacteriia bacterium]